MLKKGQLSIFIIIGIILVIVTTFLLFNNKVDFFVSPQSKINSQVSDSVKSCIENSAKTGVFLLGFQGGRINLPLNILNDPINYKKRYVDLGFKILNWDSQLGEVPTINSMKNQLDTYILNNSKNCIIENLNSLNSSLNISIVGNLSIDSVLDSNSVIIKANLPVKFNKIKDNQVFYINDYFVKLDGVELKKEFKLASKIYNLESKTNFFEKLVLEQMYSASDYSDKEHSIPMEGMNIACSYIPWTKGQLKKTLANLNNKNFKYLQFLGTYSKDNLFKANFNNNQDLKKYYQSSKIGYVRDLGIGSSNEFKNLDVIVTMPSIEQTGKKGYFQRYPYRKFEVTPSSGELVKPINLKIGSGIKIPIPCIQIYHHQYNLDYDLMVKIIDKTKDSNHYFFQFPVRILINNNVAKKKANLFINTEVLTATNDKYNLKENKIYPLFVWVKDKKNNEFLDGVNISYKCLNLEADIGKTSRLTYQGIKYGHNPFLKGMFPYCYNGEIIAKKEGYFKGIKKDVITDASLLKKNPSGNIREISLIPEIKFNIDVSSFLNVYKETGKSGRVRNSNDGQIYVDIENKGLGFENQILWPIVQKGFFDKLVLLDDKDVKYNVSVIYTDSKFNLKGMIQYTNWKPDLNKIESGSKVQFIIPSSLNKIDENNYLDFIKYMNSKLKSNKYGIIFS